MTVSLLSGVMKSAEKYRTVREITTRHHRLATFKTLRFVKYLIVLSVCKRFTDDFTDSTVKCLQ